MNGRIQRVFAVLAAMVMLIGTTPFAAAEVTADTVPAGIEINRYGETNARVYLRSGPSADAAELDTVRREKQVFVIMNVTGPDDGSLWSLVIADGTEGYIRSEYIILSGAPPAAPEPEEDPEHFQYRMLEDGTAEITRYTGTAEMLAIPDTIDGKKVTGIGEKAFAECWSLKSVTIPYGVTGIGCEAFFNCSSLASVSIPESVVSIESYVFNDCDSLTSVTIPDSVLYMGANPFVFCDNLTDIIVSPAQPILYTEDGVLFNRTEKSLVCYPKTLDRSSYSIPEGIRAIGNSAFYECGALTEIVIPGSLQEIWSWAFCKCVSLSSITIPAGVNAIYEGVFAGCNSLTVKTPAGSYAENYCRENNLRYETID